MVGVVSKGRGSTGACGFDVSFPCSVRARSSCGVGRSGMGRGCTAAAMRQPSFCPVPVACVSSFRYSGAVVTRCRGNDPPASCLLRARVLSIALAVACLFAGYVARVPCAFRARGFALRGRAITESTQLPCPLVCGRAAAGNFHKCEVRLVFGPPPPPVFRGFFWADLAWLFSIRVETKLWDLKRPASFRKQARTGFESMFRSCELYTTIDSPAIPPTPHVRGHERTGHERHTIEGFSLGGLKDTDMRPGCRFKAIC